MDDLISRQAAIKAIDDLPNCYNGYSDTYDKAFIIGVLEELSSVDVPDRKVGKWIEVKNKWDGLEIRCSECGAKAPRDEWGNAMQCGYCPNCGARMRGEEE